MLPGLSNILVTRFLSQEEIKAQGWSTTDLCFDSRRLLHYVRLLPDGRFMFGGRGGWDASEKGKARMRVYMERTFKEMLPAWADVEFTYFWNGFISLFYDLVAHISNPQGDDTVWSALAWQGIGVAAGTGAGKLVASLVKGEATAQADIPLVMRSQPPKFPFPFLPQSIFVLRTRSIA
jgi:glycine/D-amino acid oxidase-like deaminating enzyme